MPNDAAAEKARSAEHGDGTTVRYHHDSNSPVMWWGRGPAPGDRAIIRHDEVFHRHRCGGPPAVKLLLLCWCARKHSCHAFRIDVEGQEYQRLVAWVSPLVHESVRFIDQGARSPCLCLTVDRIGP